MPKTPLQNQAIKDERKKEIILSAVRLFAFKGYAETSIDDITHFTRCSHGLFYHYFHNKEDIFGAVMKYSVNCMDKLFQNVSINHSKPDLTLNDFISAIINVLVSKDDDMVAILHLLLNLFLQKDQLPKPKSGNMHDNKLGFFDLTRKLIISGQELNVFDKKEDAFVYTISLIAIIKGLTFNRLKLGQKAFICPSSNTILKLIMKGENYA